MTIEIDLSDELLIEIRNFTNSADTSQAVRIAMEEYLRSARRQRLREIPGKVTMTDNWRELENAEVKEHDLGRSSGVD